MCGICGIISSTCFDKAIVKTMNHKLLHRGPDGEGEYFDDGIGLAMRRLSIIDLESGWQPLYNEDKSLVLVLNGEIYNYLELREMLTKKGHHFSTKGDGETILHLYEEVGVKCLDYLRGMFAFALYDTIKKQLLIARDRMGEKPLYLFHDNTKLLFSSELRSLLSSGVVEKVLDPRSIDMFFHYQYVPEPYTPFKQIRKLPAGHYLLIDRDTMAIEEKCYWRMEDAPAIEGNPSELIREKLDEVARLVIRADVPVGVALSGGIDSSAIAALASRNYNGNMHAFTVGYEGRPESDERNTAKKIADYLSMPFQEIELTDNEFLNNFPLMCSITDDPIADISAFGYYSVSKAAKEHGVPVLLQGQGGDELFWGYPWIRNNYKYVLLKKKMLEKKAGLWDYYRFKIGETYKKPTLRKLAKALLTFKEAKTLLKMHIEDGANTFPLYDYFPGFNWDSQTIMSFYGETMLECKEIFAPKLPFTLDNGWDDPEITLTKLISSTYLQENGIAQGDRLSMANSVELRLPLIDYQLVETIIGLRKNQNDAAMEPKAWLNASVNNLLPKWLFTIKKRGFEPPVAKWTQKLLSNYGDELINGKLVKGGILSSDQSKVLSKGGINPGISLPCYFNALVLENWLKTIL